MSIKLNSIKNIYFYLVSLIALMMIVYGAVDILNVGLTTWVFKKADKLDQWGMPPSFPTYAMMGEDGKIADRCKDKCDLTDGEKETIKRWHEDYKNWEEQQKYLPAAQKQRKAVTDISMLVVAIPLFILHWRVARKLDSSET